jgi:signal transduction histidine kinase
VIAPPHRLHRPSSGLRLGSHLLVTSALLAFLVGGVVALLLVATSSLRGSTSRAVRSGEVAVATLTVEKQVIDLETGLRGFLLTRDDRALAPWRSARQTLPRALTRLATLVRGDAVSEQQVRTLGVAIDEYVQEYSRPLLRIARISPEAAQSSVATLEGKRRTDAIRRRISRLLAIQDARAAASAAAAGRRSNLAVAVGFGAIAASVLLVLVFGLYLARAIARPIRSAADAATHMARGDLSARVIPTGPAEVGDLTQAFNTMAESLQRSHLALEQQNARLRESERLKSELVSIVSHEVRTPLTSVIGFTSLLLSRDFDDESRNRYLGIIDDEGRRLAALLEDFLEAQQLEEGRVRLRYDSVDVAALLRSQTQAFTTQSDRHRLELRLPEEPLVVQADPGRLTQVVANLLSNSIKYSPGGGLVDVRAQRDRHCLRVLVLDEGIGIPQDQQERIFTKFFRGDAAASGIAGAGLGLAVSRAIVQAHGGRMGLTSVPGAGSTFWFEIPIAPERSERR